MSPSSDKKKNSGGGSSSSGNNNSSSSNNSSNKSADEFSEILDEIEIKIDRIEREINNLDTVASSVFNSMSVRSSSLAKELSRVSDEIDIQRRGYFRYLQQANSVGLSGYWAERVRNGDINIEEVRNEDLWDKIQSYQKWYELALDCRDAIVKLQVDEADLWDQRFNLSQKQYENEIAQYEHLYDVLDHYIKYAENRGRITSNFYYQEQIDTERKKIEELNKEYDALRSAMRESLASGDIALNSEGYYEWVAVLNDICEQISEAEANIVDLNNSIRDTNWEVFDKLAESLEHVNDELEFLYNILGDVDNFFDDKGHINNSGIAGLGVLTAQYNIALQEAQRYADEIKAIESQLENDMYNQDLLDRQNELYEGQRKLIESSNDYKDSIVSLIEKGIKAQIDSLKEVIDNYTELMDTQKDELDYAKKISTAQENISKLEKQLNAYGADTSEEGAARRQRLRSQLEDARENLAQTEEERRISQTKKMLDDLQSEYENILNSRLDNVDALIQEVVNSVDANASIIQSTIENAASEVGYIMTDPTNSIFSGSSDLVSYFSGGDFINKITNIAEAVGNIENFISDSVKAAENEAAKKVSEEHGRHDAFTGEMADAANVGTAKINATNKISGTDGNWLRTNDRWQWQNANGTMAENTWSQIDNKWYRFDENGNMLENEWFHDPTLNTRYHLAQGGAMDINKWISNGGNNLSYVDGYGRAVTGWQNLKWSKGQDWFLFDESGNMLTGLQNVGGKNYYLDTNTGAMAKNKWVSDGKYWRYFDGWGVAKTGWFYDSSAKKWAYLDPATNGGKLVNQWYYDKGLKAWYWLDDKGWMVRDGRFRTSTGMASFNSSGQWLGYKKGTRSVDTDGLYWTNEGMPETIIRKSDGAVLTRLNSGDTVINGKGTQNLWDFSNDPKKFLTNIGAYKDGVGGGNNVNMEFNLSGLKSPTEFMNALMNNKKFEKLIQEITLGRANGHGVLAKNAIKL